eukprot:Nitzschia sp. Nitz4//scaffold6_size259037//23591//25034//NITZ4_001044-RA/size259037-augustus-gene-0.282-mRNA-1//1//CDS//3329556803//8997//frame0
MNVFLSIPSEALLASAELVAQDLLNRYGISDVTIRSSSAPVDRFLDADPTVRAIWVFWSAGSMVAAGALEEESPFPVLQVDASAQPKDVSWAIAKWCSLGDAKVADRVRAAASSRRQAKLVEDAQLITKSWKYHQAIASCYDGKQQVAESGVEDAIPGKVRDRVELPNNRLALITTDRQSGFDRHLASVPFKGAVLNLTSAFWFEKTKHIIPNHIIDVPHPYVTVSRKCKPFPIEFVVRAYMTGSTSTSIWKNYQNGVRNYCGHALPEGMTKNQKLWANILTPTTKEEEHDRPISPEEIVAEKWMTQEDWDVCAKAALEVFALGGKIAADHGLILVDTKYEFGRDEETGEILLIDEVHTPDSSRYWLASSYEERIAAGKEPENIDKEFLRLWFRDQCDPYADEVLPEAPRDLVMELSRRYVTLYEMITWKSFDFSSEAMTASIKDVIDSYKK